MSETSRDADVVVPPISANAFLLTTATIVVVFLIMLALDFSLAKIERVETASHAASLYEEGNRILAAGRVDDAADRFGTAVAMERDSTRYAVALGEAQLARGAPLEAEAILRPRLESDPTDGAVTLAMARVLAGERRVDEAISYYHRAIYGRWSADTTANRNRARFELIDLLVKTNRSADLLAELLPLQDASHDAGFQKRLANLFLLAGAPTRAADVFRAILAETPNDADAYAGLGQASLARGNFVTARRELRRASALRPSEARIDTLLMVADSAIAMDVQDRRLAPMDAYQRGLQLLHRTIASVGACASVAAMPVLRFASDSAAALDSVRVAPASLEDQRDANLAFAQQVWRLRPASCAASSLSDRALATFYAALARR